MTTWQDRLLNLHSTLGREPTLDELLAESKKHKMMPEEYRAQAESWARANVSTGDPRWD